MSILESIGIIAAVGFGAAGLIFGWRADQQAKTAEQIAKESNRIAEESMAVAGNSHPDASKVRWSANVWVQIVWPVRFSDNTVFVPFNVRNLGEGHVRMAYATVTQPGYRTRPIFGIELLAPETETGVDAPIRFDASDGSRVQTDFLFRFHFSDDRTEDQVIEKCCRLSGMLGSTNLEDWEVSDLPCCSSDYGT